MHNSSNFEETMKIAKIIGFLIILILFSSQSSFGIDNKAFISNVEQKLYNTKFSTETIIKRLDRIEESVYGKTSKLSIEKRIAKLEGTFPSQSTKDDTARVSLQKQNLIGNNNNSIKYPLIDQMEQKVMGRTFAGDIINKRLERLEIAVFNGVSKASLSDRVEKLQSKVLNRQENTSQQNEEADSSDPPMDSQTINTLLSKMETETFKTTYSNESPEARLDRLENKIFNKTSPDSSINDRADRLSAVITAQPSNDLYKDASQLRQYQQVGTGITAAAILLMIIRGLL